MTDQTVQLAYVRPGRDGLGWLRDAIQSLKAGDPLRPVTILVPNALSGRQLRWALAESGFANVHTLRLIAAAQEIARPTRPPGARTLDPIVEESAVRASVVALDTAFAGVEHPSLHAALLQLYRLLRRLEIDPSTLAASARTGIARAALEAFNHFKTLTAGYDDPTMLTDAATAHLQRAAAVPPELDRLGALVLYLPTRFDPADARFLAAAASWVPLCAAFAHFADPAQTGDTPGQRAANLLADALGVSPPTPSSPALESPSRRIVRAPDPAEEVREALRGIAADLEAGVPLHRIALLYRHVDPYASMTRDALTAAGLPWASSEGRRLHESRPGRALLGLLKLPDRRFAREALMEWLETGPMLDPKTRSVGTARWNRFSRDANVVRGGDQWRDRLHGLAREWELEADQAEADDPDAPKGWLRDQAAHARAMADFVADIAVELQPPVGGTWASFATWAEGLVQRFVGAPELWPAHERPYAEDVAGVLATLAGLAAVHGTLAPTPATFVAALESALEGRSRPVGRFGTGVLVGPVAAVTGLSFDRVYLLGLVEGTFPPPPPVDPFFPVGGEDPLHRRQRHREAERQSFLTAVAAGDGGSVVLSMPDSAAGRLTFPSRWLLEVASDLAGAPLDASAFLALPAGHAWLRVVRSVLDGVAAASSPADLEDRRLAEAAGEHLAGRWLRAHPIAGRLDLPLAAGMKVPVARRSSLFTAFDGNVASVAATSRSLRRIFEGGRPTSATAVELWATCPFKYLMARVLNVKPTRHPEESWTINPLDRGNLFHDVLEKFHGTLAIDGRPGPGEAYTADDLALIEEIAAAAFDGLHARGVTGHPFAWENARAGGRADLRTLLAKDQEWRLANGGLAPASFEQAFGFEGEGSWPALELTVDGSVLRFRGRIDRVDRDPARKRAFVFDYKTGKSDDFKGIGADPVLAGTQIQMALYSRVARANLGEGWSVGGAYWFLTSRGNFDRLGIAETDRDRADARLDRVLDTIASGIKGGVFPQVPGDAAYTSSFKNCRYCDFDRICPAARDEYSAAKEADPGYLAHASLAAQLVPS